MLRVIDTSGKSKEIPLELDNDATAAVQGHATAAQITKLDGVETLADVTDAANIASALIEALSLRRVLFFDLTTYDVFETYVHDTGSISQAMAIAGVFTGANASSCARQNLNSQETGLNGVKWFSYISSGYVTGNSLGFVGIIYEAKLTETQADSNLITKHVGIWYENGQWYASCADGATQTKTAVTISGAGAVLIDTTTSGHAKFYWNNVLLADVTTNVLTGWGYMQWFVHNKALTVDKSIYFYNFGYRGA